MTLQAGESLYLAPEKQAVIENDNNDPLVMIQITTAAEMVDNNRNDPVEP